MKTVRETGNRRDALVRKLDTLSRQMLQIERTRRETGSPDLEARRLSSMRERFLSNAQEYYSL